MIWFRVEEVVHWGHDLTGVSCPWTFLCLIDATRSEISDVLPNLRSKAKEPVVQGQKILTMNTSNLPFRVLHMSNIGEEAEWR